MKIKLNQKIISIIGILIIVGVYLKNEFPTYQNYPAPDFYNAAYQIEESQVDLLNDSVRAAEQTLQNIKFQRSKYIDGISEYERTTSGPIGFANSIKEDRSYLILTNLQLNLYPFVAQSYLQYYTKDSFGHLVTLKFFKNKEADSVVYVDKTVGYRYLSEEKSIMVPLRSKVFIFLASYAPDIWFWIVVFMKFFAGLIFLVFMIAISRNQAFDFKNIVRLKMISILFLINALFPYGLNLSIYYIFISKFGDEHIIFNYSFWDKDYESLLFSIIFFLLYIAFSKGRILQQEQELTI